MSNNNAIRHLQIGKHSYPFDAASGSLQFLETIGRGAIVPMHGRNARDDYDQHDGQAIPSLQGPLEQDVGDFVFPLTGMEDGAGSGVDSSTKNHPLEDILDVCMGVGVTDDTGLTSDASAAGDSDTIISASGSMTAGSGVLAAAVGTTTMIASEIVSVSTVTHELLLARMDRDGTAVASALNTPMYASKSWHTNVDALDRDHLFGDVETVQGARYRLYGMMGGLRLVFPRGGQARAVLQGCKITNIAGPSAKANPSYSAPAQGSGIRVLDVAVTLQHADVNSGNAFLAHAFDVEVDTGLLFEERTSGASYYGWRGFVCHGMRPKISGKLRLGTISTAPAEMTHAEMHTLHDADGGVTGQVQVGRSVAGTILTTLQSADMRFGAVTNEGASEVVPFELIGNRSSNEANVPGPMRIHIF